MYYKLTQGDIVVDLLRQLRYVRYLPKSARWVGTDSQSAHGVMSSNGDKIYHLYGHPLPALDNLESAQLMVIEEAEYNMLASQFALQRKENEDLRNEIDVLRQQIQEQNSLLHAILEKL